MQDEFEKTEKDYYHRGQKVSRMDNTISDLRNGLIEYEHVAVDEVYVIAIFTQPMRINELHCVKIRFCCTQTTKVQISLRICAD